MAGTRERGYGAAHVRLRKQFAREVRAGLAVCWRCLRAISPDEPWDLGHSDTDRSQYMGPEHRGCNRRTSSRLARARRARYWSRAW